MGSVHRRMFSTLGGREGGGGCSIHQRDIMIHAGDIISTLGVFSTSEGYHEYIGGTS